MSQLEGTARCDFGPASGIARYGSCGGEDAKEARASSPFTRRGWHEEISPVPDQGPPAKA